MGNQACCEQTRTHGTLEKQDPTIINKKIIEEPKQQTAKPHEQKPDSEMRREPAQPHIQEIKPTQQPRSEIKNEPQHVTTTQKPVEVISVPVLTHKVANTLKSKDFFQKEQKDHPKGEVKKYGEDVYVGTLDQSTLRPHGFGKMYKKDQSLYIGYFNNGRAEGKGAFIFADGSYYFGDFHNNQTQCANGEYWSETVQYRGGFSNNVFEGKGIEQTRTHTFDGKFHDGSRTEGILTWQSGSHKYTYKGEFNKFNQFHGKGVLTQPEGTYDGNFVDGLKHGQGVYTFAKGSKYQGTYVKGEREGNGKIFQKDGKIAYEGQLKNGLPHGRGKVPDASGKMIETVWENGINKNLLDH